MLQARPLYWRLQLTGWAIYGALNGAVARWDSHLRFPEVLGQALSMGLLALLLTHALYRWILRHHLRSRPIGTRVAHLTALSLVLGSAAGVLANACGIAPWQTSNLPAQGPVREFVAPLIQATNWTSLLLFWSLLYFILYAWRERATAQLRESELARALQLAELRLLKSQLNPHFLFNALNTVRALICEAPTRAQEAVTQLARTLRYTLTAGQEELVPLERELAIVNDYLAIEALRLEERLRLELEIDPLTRPLHIPAMLLQTLVENAIKHGIAELPEGGLLRICSELEAGNLIVTVENARPERPPRDPVPGGIGLHNSAERLRLLFGAHAELSLDITRPGRAIARVCIPSSS